MSAFVVSRIHIHQLVSAIDQYVSPTEEPTALGQMLWDENIASVLHRYEDCTREDMPGPIGETFAYEYVTPRRTLTPVEVYRIACCYQYQSCEHDEWETSASANLMTTLLEALQRLLGKTEDQIRRLPEWEKADWEIDDDEPVDITPAIEPKPVRRISLIDTAKLLRKALKAAYPTVKFSVRCDRYSMGCSIDVTWTDGPTSGQVQPLLRQFDRKSFDGMTDSSSYHTQEYEGETVAFGADYVSGQRHISTAFMRQIACKVAAQYKVPVPMVENSGEKYGTDHGHVPSTPESNVTIDNAPPFWRTERLLDVIHHVAHQTSALSKPRIRIMPIVREVVID